MNPDLPTIAAFWVGPYLSWMEQMGLLSFVRHGHKVVLYTHGEVKNIPVGIEVRPASEIWDVNEVKIFSEVENWDLPNPLVINSDFFKWPLQLKTDYIYADADHFCLQPIAIFSRENFILRGAMFNKSRFFRMPENSPTVKLACDFLVQKYPVPWWFSRKDRRRLRLRKLTGRSKPITRLRWGVAGDEFLASALHKTGEHETVYDASHFFWSVKKDKVKNLFYLSPEDFSETFLLKRYYVLAANWPQIYHHAPKKFLEVPPENSWIGQQARALGVNPADAPVLETRQKNNQYARLANEKR